MGVQLQGSELDDQPPVIAVVGPTATGKSEVAVRLASELDGEVISCDALQAYRGLEIGTAKPTATQRLAVPHHLVDVLDADQPFSAGRFAELARTAVADISSRRRRVVLAGGSGLYLRALVDGLSPLPPSDRQLRAWLERVRKVDHRWLWRALEVIDPASASRLSPGDRQRVGRALELALGSGFRWSDWIARAPERAPLRTVWIGLTLPRGLLYDRIAGRVWRMIEAGWTEEVARLLAVGVSPEAPAFQAIGYRQLVRHHFGEQSLEETAREIILATRRYAKRQLTWFRRQTGVHWFSVEDLTAVIPHIVARVRAG